MTFKIPRSKNKRIVIVGAGFGGFYIANKLKGKGFQLVLIDKNNYHQFQPLFYQVAMAGLEPSSISFPLRKNFRNDADLFVRVADVQEIRVDQKCIVADIGMLDYDYLVIATGSVTNYYGNDQLKRNSIPLKSVSEALYLRNRILEDLEQSVRESTESLQNKLLDIVVVGGGPTGVELAGSLAEMRKNILPKDYPDLDFKLMDIYIVQGSKRLLPGMSEQSSTVAYKYLQQMGVQVLLNTRVDNIESEKVSLSNGSTIFSKKVIWAAGVMANPIKGLPSTSYNEDHRILIDEFCKIKEVADVYAIGDVACQISEKYPYGLPGIAPVAIQQAKYLSDHLLRICSGTESKSFPFHYTDKGQMATIGRHKAVFDWKKLHLKGPVAWLVWLLIHIYYLVGVRNKIVVIFNWVWSYIFYDHALRLNIKPYKNE